MSTSPIARHWQWISLRVRRTRRAVPSVLFVLFVIATASIFFFPDLELSSFASRSATAAVRQGEKVLAQNDHNLDHIPPPTEYKEAPLISPIVASKGLAEDDPVIKNITKLRSELAENYKIDYWRGARAENDIALERLSTCLQAGSCGPGEEKVVLLATFHFGHAKLGMVSGEDIWARSSLEAFTALNYTLMYTYGHMDTLLIYQHIPDLVQVIIWESEQMKRCMGRTETNHNMTELKGDEMVHSPDDWQKDLKKGCMKRAGFEDGIPLWKGFTFHFWPTPSHPLGEKWTLAPYDYSEMGKDNIHLGYSIQEGCEKIPLVEKKKHRAIVLGKRPDYFQPEKLAWPNMLPEVARDISPVENSTPEGDDLESFSFVGAFNKNKNTEVISNAGIESVGQLDMAGWFEAVGSSKAMLGVGEPYISPSPFDGLCQGTPFINVIKHWDEKDPENKTKWRTQHDPLISMGAPYIYHVRKGDKEGLETAVRSAVDNPIGRYIPPTMTRESVRERHRLLIETDWSKAGKTRIDSISYGDEDFPFLP